MSVDLSQVIYTAWPKDSRYGVEWVAGESTANVLERVDYERPIKVGVIDNDVRLSNPDKATVLDHLVDVLVSWMRKDNQGYGVFERLVRSAREGESFEGRWAVNRAVEFAEWLGVPERDRDRWRERYNKAENLA